MNTRIEILRGGVWYPLELANTKAIEYNAVINTIGKIASREISHTNTFSIPLIQQNVSALGLNRFNQQAMAKSLNQKYLANYFVEDKIVRTGYVVINNSKGGSININFIDEALDLVDKWGSITYQELLKDTVIEIPSDYEAAIEELDSYDLDVNTVLTPLSQVGTRGYNLCLFPNSLNAIGDAFQIDDNDLRVVDAFNPYQSRPVWNVKALFDLATESYGYTPIYDDSVDWDYVATQYIVEEGQDQNEKGLSGIQTLLHGEVSSSVPYQNEVPDFFAVIPFYQYSTLVLYPGSVALKPNNIPGWIDPLWLAHSWSWTFPGTDLTPWMSQNCVFAMDVDSGNVGEVVINFRTGAGGLSRLSYSNIWKSAAEDYNYVIHDTGGNQLADPPDFTLAPMVTGFTVTPLGNNVLNASQADVTIVLDKSYLNTAINGPVGTSYASGNASDYSLSGFTSNGFTGVPSSFTKTSTGTGTIVQNSGTFSTAGTKYQIRFDLNPTISGTLDGTLTFKMGNESFINLIPDGLGFGSYVVTYTTTSNASVGFTFSGTFRGQIENIYIHEEGLVGDYIGTMVSYGRGLASSAPGSLYDMSVSEEYLPPSVIAFDEFGQYLPSNPDLRHSAPRKSVKDLLSAYMHKDGILMDINAKQRTVKFFNYGEYEANKINGEYIDFSEYHLKYGNIEFNTNYGNDFAKLNRIGLSSPYPGNTYDFTLDNQGEESKFKDFTTNNNKLFKDIEQVVSVPNVTTPYFEYTNQGLGLVEYAGNLGALSQQRADGSVQGSFSGLAQLANVNFASLPEGTKYWYDLVDKGVRASAQFLIPVDVMNRLDMSKPIYVEELGGYYIIEKVEQYINGQTPVTLKLIKLIDDLRKLVEYGGGTVDPDPTISLSASSMSPNNFTSFIYQIFTTTIFNNYTPTSATLEYRKLNGADVSLGYTGHTVSYDFDLTAVNNSGQFGHSLNASLPITDFEAGHYEMQVIDNTSGLQSNLEYGVLGDLTVYEPRVGMFVFTRGIYPTLGLGVGEMRVSVTYWHHVPTTSTFTYRLRSYTDPNLYLGDEVTVDLFTDPDSTPDYSSSGLSSHTINITPTDGPGFYVVSASTDQADSPAPMLGGYFVT